MRIRMDPDTQYRYCTALKKFFFSTVYLELLMKSNVQNEQSPNIILRFDCNMVLSQCWGVLFTLVYRTSYNTNPIRKKAK
jgi:hypothetical protein